MQFKRRLVAGQKLLIILLLLGATGAVLAQGLLQPRAADPSIEIRILLIEGTVEVLRAGTQTWAPAVTNQVLRAGDRLRTRAASQVALRWSDKSVLRLNELGDFQIQTPPAQQKGGGRFTLWQGILYFFHRDRPGNIQFNTRTASAAVRGTEFNLEAEANGRTVLTLIEGEVDLENPSGRIQVSGGEQAIAEPGRVPYLSARLDLMRAIQWTLYYPAVLDLEEAGLNVPVDEIMPSLEAYRRGDLLSALNQYPPERTPQSDGERIYLAALALAVGQVERSETWLGPLAAQTDHPTSRLATALQTMIGVVQGRHSFTNPPPQSATEWLVQSYRHQGSFELERALADARTAARQNPRFGFAWARVAELEFSFGRVEAAQLAVAKALTLTPRNAEALALRGFLAAAQNQITLAIRYFGEALAVDPSLGHAWLGRGLSRIRQGHGAAGRDDLLVAASLEPHRSSFRSYLSKAYADAGERGRAETEIQLAKQFDPGDPTPWFYSALLRHQNNRVNEAIADLERSQALNQNRELYRSRLLLDQDRAVRSANLAAIYRDAGMMDVSVREAAKAVNADYANYSAHLFLANSYNELRDPNRANLRYETAASSEYLVANLLAPVSAGVLSRSVSQQEYSKLFERDRFGVISDTEYRSHGAWQQQGAQYGIFGSSSYVIDASYRSDNGYRANDDFEERILSLQIKQELTPRDTVVIQALHYDAEGGDVAQYRDLTRINAQVRNSERHEPDLILGYHHEWNPHQHTLFLAGRAQVVERIRDPAQVTHFVSNPGVIDFIQPIFINEDFKKTLEIYSAELQQIWQTENHQTILGGRMQLGEFTLRNLQLDPTDFSIFFPLDGPAAAQRLTVDFERMSAYLYHHWRLAERFTLFGGLSYDRVVYPDNFRSAPVSDQQRSRDAVLPKAGLSWTPTDQSNVRLAYSRSLGGASLDQSFRLEPSQVAGINQAYRSIMPESVGGSDAGVRMETFGVVFDQRFPTRTYLGLSGEFLRSKAGRTLGVFEFTDPAGFTTLGGLRETIAYEEKSVQFTLNQLVARQWALGMRYRFSQAELEDFYPQVPSSAFLISFIPDQELEATLHQLAFHAIFNHACGFFAQAEALWYRQESDGYYAPTPDSDFWQMNLLAGYRFPRKQAEITVGLLNIADRNYNINPLNFHNDLPRDRTFVARLRFNF